MIVHDFETPLEIETVNCICFFYWGRESTKNSTSAYAIFPLFGELMSVCQPWEISRNAH